MRKTFYLHPLRVRAFTAPGLAAGPLQSRASRSIHILHPRPRKCDSVPAVGSEVGYELAAGPERVWTVADQTMYRPAPPVAST